MVSLVISTIGSRVTAVGTRAPSHQPKAGRPLDATAETGQIHRYTKRAPTAARPKKPLKFGGISAMVVEYGVQNRSTYVLVVEKIRPRIVCIASVSCLVFSIQSWKRDFV